jgi:hypothetical protein
MSGAAGLPSAQVREIAALLAATRVLVRRLAEGTAVDPRRLVRLARGLVRAAEAGDPAFLGVTALAEGYRDPGGRAGLLALIAIAAAREITTSRRALCRLALTVLVAGAGEAPRVEGGEPHVESPDEARRVPAATAAALIAMLGADPGALRVADAGFEAAWLERRRALGPLHLEPQVTARILHVARALLDRIAPEDGSEPQSPLDALPQVGALVSVDPAAYRCLVRALGVTPAGAVVELEGGEWGVVLAPSSAADPLDRPRLRLLTDAAGRARPRPVEIDLADPACQGYRIARLVDPAAASPYVMAAFVGG